MPLFETHFKYILDFNLKCFEVLLNSLQLDIQPTQTTTFEKEPVSRTDYRGLVKRNSVVKHLKPYTQVFTEKHGFISNLSILDVVFNEGPNTVLYLKKLNLSID